MSEPPKEKTRKQRIGANVPMVDGIVNEAARMLRQLLADVRTTAQGAAHVLSRLGTADDVIARDTLTKALTKLANLSEEPIINKMGRVKVKNHAPRTPY